MRATKKSVAQWALLCLLYLLGIVAFFFVVGEENPEKPLPSALFLLIKAGASVGLLVCVLVGKWFNRRGWLPDLEKYFGNGNHA